MLLRRTTCLRSLGGVSCQRRVATVRIRRSAAGVYPSVQTSLAADNGQPVQVVVVNPTDAPPAQLAPPPKAYQIAADAGAAKAKQPVSKILLLGILAGVYIAFGSFLAMTVGGNCPGLAASNPGLKAILYGSFGLPFGLLMVLVCGADLFTGNTALATVALWERKIQLGDLVKSWTVSYVGNLMGAVLLALMVYGSGLLTAAAAPKAIAAAKCSLPFLQAFLRGVMCNWLVCIAIWQASAAATLPGKVAGVFFPISAFVALGLEHCVANMFFIPVGILHGADVTVSQFLLQNLLPVTLGNIVGGALCVGAMYALVYGSAWKAHV